MPELPLAASSPCPAVAPGSGPLRRCGLHRCRAASRRSYSLGRRPPTLPADRGCSARGRGLRRAAPPSSCLRFRVGGTEMWMTCHFLYAVAVLFFWLLLLFTFLGAFTGYFCCLLMR